MRMASSWQRAGLPETCSDVAQPELGMDVQQTPSFAATLGQRMQLKACIEGCPACSGTHRCALESIWVEWKPHRLN